jgi:hypothetical protein
VGFVYLDNIQVNQQIWTSPRDNPKGKGKNDKDSDDKDSDDHHDDDSDDHHD